MPPFTAGNQMRASGVCSYILGWITCKHFCSGLKSSKVLTSQQAKRPRIRLFIRRQTRGIDLPTPRPNSSSSRCRRGTDQIDRFHSQDTYSAAHSSTKKRDDCVRSRFPERVRSGAECLPRAGPVVQPSRLGKVAVVPEDLYAHSLATRATGESYDLLLIPWTETGSLSEAPMVSKNTIERKLRSDAYSTFVSEAINSYRGASAVFVNKNFSGSLEQSPTALTQRLYAKSGRLGNIIELPAVDRSHHVFMRNALVYANTVRADC